MSLELIKNLKSSKLYAECTCGEEFKLSDAVLFDGLSSFPDVAETKRKEFLDELSKRMDELKKRKLYVDVGAEKKTIEVGFGKIIEKIVPAHKAFNIARCDCRPLFEPIDFIVFNGMSEMNINSVTFLEVKTGNSKLSSNERKIRDAVDDKRVEYKAI